MSINQWGNDFKERGQYHCLVLDPFIVTKTCLEKMHGVQRTEQCTKIRNMASGRRITEKSMIGEFDKRNRSMTPFSDVRDILFLLISAVNVV